MTSVALTFGAGVSWRRSRRGLVVCGDDGSPLLIEHPRACELPELVSAAPGPEMLVAALGGTKSDRRLVDNLISEGIVCTGAVAASTRPPEKRLTFTRSGVEFSGIASVATAVHRFAMPVVTSALGRVLIVGILIAGVVSIVVGRPEGPQVSAHPWMDATLGLAVGLALAALHELAHAVALVHYGRLPRRAGCGFYWGAISFYVDSSDGITLPRRARIINALAGIAVDLVTTSVLLVASQLFAATTLAMAVCWRVATLQLLTIVEGGLPILENDGHVALADYLDEPDLAPRSREALGRRLRNIAHDEQPRWLATYGAVSLLAGLVLLVVGSWVWWLAVGDLLLALIGGNPAEIALGLYVVVPFVLGVVFSLIGLTLELVVKPVDGRAGD